MKKRISISSPDIYLFVDQDGNTSEVPPPDSPPVSSITPAPTLPTTRHLIIKCIVQQLVNNIVLKVCVLNFMHQLVNNVVQKLETKNTLQHTPFRSLEDTRRTQSVQNLKELNLLPRSQSCGELTSQCHSPFLSNRSILTTTRVTQLAEDPNLFNKVMNTNNTVSFRFPYLGLREPQKTIQIPHNWKWYPQKRMLSWEEANISINFPTRTSFSIHEGIKTLEFSTNPSDEKASITVTNGADVSTYHDIICSDNVIRLINTETNDDQIICNGEKLPERQLCFTLLLPPRELSLHSPCSNNKTIHPHTKQVQKNMMKYAAKLGLYDLLSKDEILTREEQLQKSSQPNEISRSKLEHSKLKFKHLDNYLFAYLMGLVYQTPSFKKENTLQLLSDIVMVVFNIDDLLDHSASKLKGDVLQQIITYAPGIFSGEREIPGDLGSMPFLIGLQDTGSRLRKLIKQPIDTDETVQTKLENTITAFTDYLLEIQVEKKYPEFIAKTEADLIKLRESRRKTTAINFFCHLGFALIGNPPIIQTHLFEQALFLTNDLVGSDNDLISLFKEQLAGSAGRTNFEARRKLHDPDPINSETQWREETVTKLNTIISELLITAKRETDPNIEANSFECISLLINWVNGNLIWSDMSSRYKFSWNPDTSKFESKALPNKALIDQFTCPQLTP